MRKKSWQEQADLEPQHRGAPFRAACCVQPCTRSLYLCTSLQNAPLYWAHWNDSLYCFEGARGLLAPEILGTGCFPECGLVWVLSATLLP